MEVKNRKKISRNTIGKRRKILQTAQNKSSLNLNEEFKDQEKVFSEDDFPSIEFSKFFNKNLNIR